MLDLKCDAVFEGGGVRGIGHIGAAYMLEKSGYEFRNLAGSSAGAIVSSLLAVGYTTQEIKKEMENLEYIKFKEKDWLSKLGTVGKFLNLYFNFGIYDADFFENWLEALLIKKGITTFGDIKNKKTNKYKLQITASDVTDQKLLILPNDLNSFGIDPDSFSIAKAVRMSMSIPLFYKPYKLYDKDKKVHLIVDGGLLSNYPLWILDDGTSDLDYPVLGFRFVEEEKLSDNPFEGKIKVIDYLKQITSTALDANDNRHISKSKGDFERTILIPVTVEVDEERKNIKSTNFDITKDESNALFNNGVKSATKFLEKWNFASWKRTYRDNIIS